MGRRTQDGKTQDDRGRYKIRADVFADCASEKDALIRATKYLFGLPETIEPIVVMGKHIGVFNNIEHAGELIVPKKEANKYDYFLLFTGDYKTEMYAVGWTIGKLFNDMRREEGDNYCIPQSHLFSIPALLTSFVRPNNLGEKEDRVLLSGIKRIEARSLFEL